LRKSVAPGEPFGFRLWFDPGEIGDICQDALYTAGCMPEGVAPVEIDLFIEKRFSCPVEYVDLKGGIIGCTQFDDAGTVRRVMASNAHFELENKTVGERWVRATLAHEAGHGLLHGELFSRASSESEVAGTNYDFVNKRVMCRAHDQRGNSKNYDGRWWEWQANRAIGGLLMPRDLVDRWLREEGLVTFTDSGPMTLGPLLDGPIPTARREDLRNSLADALEVNEAVVAIRMHTLAGLDALYEGLTTEVPRYGSPMKGFPGKS